MSVPDMQECAGHARVYVRLSGRGALVRILYVCMYLQGT
jgi:hypothetical protein